MFQIKNEIFLYFFRISNPSEKECFLQVNFSKNCITEFVFFVFEGKFFELICSKFNLLVVFIIQGSLNVRFGISIVKRNAFVEHF